MTVRQQAGDFVHVVATVDTQAPEGRILYVNPATSATTSDAEVDPEVELVVTNAEGAELARSAVVVRRSSCEPGRSNRTGLVQADLPRQAGMKSIDLMVRGQSVAHYEAGAPAPPPANVALNLAAGPSPHRQLLSLSDLPAVAPTAGVTYSVQVKPDNSEFWNTIAVGKATPNVELDRNQFSGARRAAVRVLRTTGFDEDVMVDTVVDLST
jgi:hypothetical protein